jgi:hypothetical protein
MWMDMHVVHTKWHWTAKMSSFVNVAVSLVPEVKFVTETFVLDSDI